MPTIAPFSSGSTKVLQRRARSSDESELWANMFTPGAGFAGEHKITFAYTIKTPHAVVDAQGNVITAWSQSEGLNNLNVYAATRSPGGVWSEPVPLESDNRANANQTLDEAAPRLGIDATGNVTAVWRKRENPANNYTIGMWGARRPTGSAWGASVRLAEMPMLRVLWPDFVMADNGIGMAGFVYGKDEKVVLDNPPTWRVFTVLLR
jgi:hypothetical protein